MFPLVTVRKLPRCLSDHNPLLLGTADVMNMKTPVFRFELHWLQHPDFVSTVEKTWNEPVREQYSIDVTEMEEAKEIP